MEFFCASSSDEVSAISLAENAFFLYLCNGIFSPNTGTNSLLIAMSSDESPP